MILCFSQYLSGPLVAISLVKDCLFSFSGQTEQIMCLPSSVCRKGPVRPWGLETFTNTQNHRKHPKENVASLSTPQLPLSLLSFLPAVNLGPKSLRKGQRWVREKHRGLSDGLALSDPDSPTQSLHLKGHFHETSNIRMFSTILTISLQKSYSTSYKKSVFLFVIQPWCCNFMKKMESTACYSLNVRLHSFDYWNFPGNPYQEISGPFRLWQIANAHSEVGQLPSILSACENEVRWPNT